MYNSMSLSEFDIEEGIDLRGFLATKRTLNSGKQIVFGCDFILL